MLKMVRSALALSLLSWWVTTSAWAEPVTATFRLEDRNCEELLFLGDMHLYGKGVPVSVPKALNLFQMAYATGLKEKENTSSKAAMRLGELFDKGLGMSPVPQQALLWYRRAILNGSNDARLPVARLLAKTGDREAALSLCQDLRNGGVVEAGKEMENILQLISAEHQMGASSSATASSIVPSAAYPTEDDIVYEESGTIIKLHALTDLRQQANKGDPDACFRLGMHFKTKSERGLAYRMLEAIRWFDLAERGGSTKARDQLIHLSTSLLDEEAKAGMPREQKETLQGVLERSGKKGFGKAQLLLARLQQFTAPRSALGWAKLAANQGDYEAMEFVADCYRHGTGCKRDIKAAIRLYTQAGKQLPRCYDHLADLFERGEGVKRDLKTAFCWRLMAAEGGDLAAELRVAQAYDSGSPVAKDLHAALHWYLSYAEAQVSSQTSLRLAWLFTFGPEDMRNAADALNWYMEGLRHGADEELTEEGEDRKIPETFGKGELGVIVAKYPTWSEACLGLFHAIQNQQVRSRIAKEYPGLWLRAAVEFGTPQIAALAALEWMDLPPERLALRKKQSPQESRVLAGRQSCARLSHIAFSHLSHAKQVDFPPLQAEAFEAWLHSLQQLAEEGDPNARADLGWLHVNGVGVVRSQRLASAWLRKAAAGGHLGALALDASLYRQDDAASPEMLKSYAGVRSAVIQAKGELRPAPRTDYQGLQKRLVAIVGTKDHRTEASERAFGVPSGTAQSVALSQFAMRFNLSEVKARALIRDKEKLSSRTWESVDSYQEFLTNLAERGIPEAMIALGTLYEQGYLVKRDRVRAYAWFDIACAAGAGDPKVLDNLEYYMQEQEISAAQQQAVSWLTDHPGPYPKVPFGLWAH